MAGTATAGRAGKYLDYPGQGRPVPGPSRRPVHLVLHPYGLGFELAPFTTYNFLRAAALLGLAIAIPLGWRSALWVFFPPVRVAYIQAVVGRVTAVFSNRQYYLQQLDGRTYHSYDFNAFVPAASTVDRNTLSQEAENELVLGAIW